MEVAAGTAVASTFDAATAILQRRPDADQLVSEIEGMASSMGLMADTNSATVVGYRVGLIRLIWHATASEHFAPEPRREAEDRPEMPFRNATTARLLGCARMRRLMPDKETIGKIIEMAGGAEAELAEMLAGNRDIMPGRQMLAACPKLDEADFLKLVNYPSDGKPIDEVDVAYAAIIAVEELLANGPLVPDLWWTTGQIVNDCIRF